MPSFDEFANFVREWAAIPKSQQIAPEMRFEDDLGITGDDGCELLEETERRFGVCLVSPEEGHRRTFDLGPNEFLFHSEGFGPSWSDIFGSSSAPVVREFTVGELFNAVKIAPAKDVSRRCAHINFRPRRLSRGCPNGAPRSFPITGSLLHWLEIAR